jgi:hypothetical protein
MHHFCAFLANKAQETLHSDLTERFEVLPHYHEGSLLIVKDQSVRRNNVDWRPPFDLYLTLEHSPSSLGIHDRHEVSLQNDPPSCEPKVEVNLTVAAP